MANRQAIVDICEDITCFSLMEVVGNNEVECLRWLQSVGVIPYLNESHFLCPETRDQKHEMKIRPKSNGIVKFSVYCRTCRNLSRNRTAKEHSLANHTWISGSHLNVKNIIQLTFSWIMQLRVIKAAQQCRITKQTAIDWFSFCRQVCGQFALQRRIGGNGHLVEVDEHHLVKKKYGRGHDLISEEVVVWGAFDQTTKQVIVQRTPNQTHQSLLALIGAFIEPGSIILSDGALRSKSDDLVAMGYHMHYWVNHSAGTYAEQVTDPLYGEIIVTTNHLEHQWREMDGFIKSYQNDNHVDQYIDQYIYYKNNDFANLSDGQKFGTFLYDISQLFPGHPRKQLIDPNETLVQYYDP